MPRFAGTEVCLAKHHGSCHCGRVTFEFDGDVSIALECNCSICRRKAAIWHGTDDEHFRILTGTDDMCVYRFGTMTAGHYFCRHCGVSTFSRPRLAPAMWVVNLRCVESIDLSAIRLHPFDGENWEQAAQRFLQARVAGMV